MPTAETITLHVNGKIHQLELDPGIPLLYVLRNDLGLKAAKYGCGTELCGACKVLIDGVDAPSCQLPVSHVAGVEITTLEGLGDADELHPLQETFLEEQAAQCGFCTAGMIIGAQGLLNRVRYPTDDEIRAALDSNLCRCGVYDRVRRAIKLRTGRLEQPIYQVIPGAPLEGDDIEEAPSPSLAAHPDIDDWIQFNADGSVSVFSGKAELGQGIKTALAQVAAEELDVALERINLVTADTGRTPDEGGTTGSRSLETSGAAIRLAAANARHHLLSLAFEQLESLTAADKLEVEDGVISDPLSGRSVSYWDLLAGSRFDRRVRRLPVKDPSSYQFVGTPARRIDLMNKVTGGISYVHDMELPGMLHARVLRPPGYHARLDTLDREAISQLPNLVELVQNGQFIALVAEREEQALDLVEAARAYVTWRHEGEIPPAEAIFRDLQRNPAHAQLIKDGSAVDDPVPPWQAPLDAHRTLNAAYKRPFQMHASLGPSAALALWENDQLTVWSHSQAAFGLRDSLAQVLAIDAAKIRVIHAEGAGCYGHNGAEDAALDAALVAIALPGRPVSLKWTRWDEHAWEPYGTAMQLELRASLSAAGDIIDWNHDVWSYGHSTRPAVGLDSSGLLAARHLAQPFAPQRPRAMGGYHAGAHRNADPIYDFPPINASSVTLSPKARCVSPRCAVWALTPMYSPSSHSWTNWRLPPALTR